MLAMSLAQKLLKKEVRDFAEANFYKGGKIRAFFPP